MAILTLCMTLLVLFSTSLNASKWWYVKEYPWVYDNNSSSWLYIKDSYIFSNKTKEWSPIDTFINADSSLAEGEASNTSSSDSTQLTPQEEDPDWYYNYEYWKHEADKYGGIENLTKIKDAKTNRDKEFWFPGVGRKLGMDDLTPLGGLVDLTTLSLNIQSVTNIDKLATLTNLSSLSIVADVNNITDLNALAGLKNLSFLALSRNNNLADLSPLANLVNLKELHLGQCNISSVIQLRKLTKLEKLYLSTNSLSDLSPLSNLTKLTNLRLAQNPSISDVSPLRNLTKLQELILDATSISDPSPLQSLTSLTRLLFYNNSFSIDQKVALDIPLSGLTIEYY